MNIQNITELAEQVRKLGFQDLDHLLAKRICFRPVRFSINRSILHQKDQVDYTLVFQKDEGTNVYRLSYYDASLYSNEHFGSLSKGGAISELSQRMAGIDWQRAFEDNTDKNWRPVDLESRSVETEIEDVIEALEELEKTNEGKTLAADLKIKYWIGTGYEKLFKSLPHAKPKNEVSQRFFCSEHQPMITAEEAYRFLLNRLAEKEIKTREKLSGNLKSFGEGGNTTSTAGPSGKRRNSQPKSNRKAHRA